MIRASELYACLVVRELPAQALLRLRPEDRDKACVVMDGEPPFEAICSLNTKARLLRMRQGMTRTEVESFPQAKVLSRSLKTESAVKAMLLECAAAYSPRVEDNSEESCFLGAIDIAGTAGLFGPPEILVRRILQHVQSLGLSARVTVSSNFHTAACLAKDSAPRRIQVIQNGEEAAALASLPLAVLNLADEQAEIFSLWGVHSLGMLAALPAKELIARLGQEGHRLQQLARGELPHLFQPVEPPFRLEERHELEFPLESLDSLMFGIAVMLDQMILRAKARLVALAEVTVTLELEGGEMHTRRVRPAQPGNEKQFWIRLLHLDLQAHPPQAAVLAVSLLAEPGSTSRIQLGLFSPPLPEPSRLDVTLAQLASLLGDGNIGRAVLQDSHAPESFRVEPFSVSAGSEISFETTRTCAAVRQLRPPETAVVTLECSQPSTFSFRARRFAVEHAYGPWLAGGDWWNKTLWGAEEWDLVARAADGVLLCCCMVRDLLRDEWQVTALYD
jgi:protein ImuB